MNARVKELDGLRVISVALVFFTGYHWMLPFGWIGVLIFYVLSGFLITRILLDERAFAIDEDGARSFFGRFYFRRTLRIFPLYFAYLFALELCSRLAGAPEHWSAMRPFAWTYTVNYALAAGVPPSEAYGHLWTLSVEEQFYLAWPLVVWACSRVWLGRLAIALVLLGPAVRWVSMYGLGLTNAQLYLSSFSHLDAFACGAVLATYDFAKVKRPRLIAAGMIAATLVSGVLVAKSTGLAIRTLGWTEGLRPDFGQNLWGYSLLNLTAAMVILAILRGELPGLGSPVLAYLGKISYGIYLFQRPAKAIWIELCEPRLSSSMPRSLVLALGALTAMAVSVGLAAASYRWFEAPLLRWRDRRCAPVHPRPLSY